MKRKLPKLKTMKKKIKPLQSEPKQLFNKNIKHPYLNRVGERSEMMRQFYRAETSSKENSHPVVIDGPSAENNVLATYGVTPSMEQQLTTQTELDDETIDLALKYLRQKQPPEVFCKKRCSQKFHKIHRKTPVPESPF